MAAKDFKYEIVKEIGALSEGTKGWRKEMFLKMSLKVSFKMVIQTCR